MVPPLRRHNIYLSVLAAVREISHHLPTSECVRNISLNFQSFIFTIWIYINKFWGLFPLNSSYSTKWVPLAKTTPTESFWFNASQVITVGKNIRNSTVKNIYYYTKLVDVVTVADVNAEERVVKADFWSRLVIKQFFGEIIQPLGPLFLFLMFYLFVFFDWIF